MHKDEMFDWLSENKVSVSYHPYSKWTREDGSAFYSDFVMSAGGIQFAPAESLEQAIIEAKRILP